MKISTVKEGIGGITEIFVPGYHYGDIDVPTISVSTGDWKYDKVKNSSTT